MMRKGVGFRYRIADLLAVFVENGKGVEVSVSCGASSERNIALSTGP